MDSLFSYWNICFTFLWTRGNVDIVVYINCSCAFRCVPVYLCVCMFVWTCVLACICMHVWSCMLGYDRVCVHVHHHFCVWWTCLDDVWVNLHLWFGVCLSLCVCMCMPVYACVCMHVCVSFFLPNVLNILISSIRWHLKEWPFHVWWVVEFVWALMLCFVNVICMHVSWNTLHKRRACVDLPIMNEENKTEDERRRVKTSEH